MCRSVGVSFVRILTGRSDWGIMIETLVIGCGNIAGGFDEGRPADAPPFTHAGAYRENPAFTVTACMDPDAGRRETFRDYWGVGDAVESLSDLHGMSGRFGVVSICSPTDWHASQIEDVLALRPRLIFCEKPLAKSLVESQALARRCADAGILLAINYTRRWDPQLVALAGELAAGARGAVRSVSATYGKGIVHNGSHMIDLLAMLFGELDIVAVGQPSFDFWPDDPSAPALLRSADGVPISLSINHSADYAMFECTIVTEAGTLTMLDGGRRWAERRATVSKAFAGYRDLGDIEVRAGGYDLAMRGAVANIAAALAEGQPLASDGGNAVYAQRICEEIRDRALALRPIG